MSEFFCAKDFMGISPDEGLEGFANKANELIKERGKRVYGFNHLKSDHWSWSNLKEPDLEPFDTHQALLINIEELPRKECTHDIDTAELFKTYGFLNAKCRHCGISVRAKWVVSE